MATDKEIVFKVEADTSGANSSIQGFSDKITKENKEVQEQFKELRDRIKLAEKEVDSMADKFGLYSKQADESRKVLANLNNQYATLSKSNTDLSATFEDVYGETMDVNRAIGELEDRMYMLHMQGQQNTQEFKDLQAQVVEYRKAVMSVDKAVDQLAEKGKILGGALQIGSAVVAGYGVAQGAMAVFGEENEELVKTLTKLQTIQTALMSLEELKLQLDSQSIIVTKAKAVATTALTAIQNGYTTAMTASNVAMKALRLSMLALPIVAIIAGIGALVAIIYDLVKSNETAQASYDNLTKSIDAQNNALDRVFAKAQRNAQNEIALAKARGASLKEINDLELRALADEEVYRRKSVINLENSLYQKKLIYQDAMKEENYELAMQLDKKIKAERKQKQDLLDLEGQYQIDVQIKNLEFQNTLSEQEKSAREKRNADWKKAQEDRKKAQEEADKLALERSRLMEDLIVQQIEDSNVRRLAELELQQERERQSLIKQYGEDTALLTELEKSQALAMQTVIDEIEEEARIKRTEQQEAEYQKAKELQDRELKDRRATTEARLLQIQSDFEAEMALKEELALIEMEQALAQENLTEGEKFKIQEEYNAKLRELEEQRKEHAVKIQNEIKEATVNVFSMGINAMQGLSDLFYDSRIKKAQKGSAEELKLEKKKFETNKKLQIAQAVMQGVQGVQAAFSSGAAIPVVGAIMGPVFAALAGVMAGVNVAKIKNQNFEGGGGSASVSTPSVSAPNIPSVDTIFQEETGTTLTDSLQDNNQTNVVIVQTDLEKASAQSNNTAVISNFG